MQKARDTRYKKISINSNTEINFDSDMLKLYLAVDPTKNLLDIFREVKLERSVFKDCLLKLYKLKLIEQIKEEVDSIDDAFLTHLREVLVNVAGPLGELLLEEAADEMNLEMSAIPKSRIADLVYQVANDIPGEKQAVEFKKIMLQEIKKLES